MIILYKYIDAEIRMHHSRDENPYPENFPIHAHEMHELFYFISGRGEYYVEGNAYPLIPGSVMLFCSGETHHLKISSAYPYERIALHFVPQLLAKLDHTGVLSPMLYGRALGKRNQYRPEQLRTGLVQSCMMAISDEPLCSGYSQERQRLLILSNLYAVLCELRRCFDFPPDSSETTDNAINRVIDYINNHLLEHFNLDYLSEIAAISKSYLNRQFQKVTGTSPWEYIILKRLILARQYIKEGMPAGQTALLCGWSDYSSFFRQYKMKFGCSPLEDRVKDISSIGQTKLDKPLFDIE